MGDTVKSLTIFFARSSTMMPNAPSVDVMEITARIPAMIQLFIRKSIPSTSSMPPVIVSPRNTAYSAMMINTASREKNTELLSLKNTFKLRFVIAHIISSSLPRL